MDAQRREWRGGAVLVRDNVVEAVGDAAVIGAHLAADPRPDLPIERVDARGCVVLPGLINGHHHLFQTLTRTVGTGRGHGLFDWLKLQLPMWGRLTPEAARVSAAVGIAELMLSGATTVVDHLYLYPNGTRLDDTIEAARALGVRFHPTRGSMSLGESAGGLPPDHLVENEAAVLADSERLIEQFHDPAPYSMLRVSLAPCSPFTVTGDLMRESARLARSHRAVRLHTHLAETADETRFCQERFGMRPVEYAASLDWLGPDVWFAHMVFPDGAEIARMARTESGVCHCPSSNMILASGIAPVRAMRDAGVNVGLGADGSASNDGNHLLGEARQAMLLQRVGWPGFESSADRFSAREALELATLGGAAILGRDDLGSLQPGKAADLVAFRVDGLEAAGAQSDPVAALVTTAPGHAWLSVINGRVVVSDGALRTIDVPPLVRRHNQLSRALISGRAA